MLKEYRLLDEVLFEHIDRLPVNEQGEWLVLSPHSQFRGRWLVDCLEPNFYFDFEDIIGRFKTVAPSRLDEFLSRAEDLKYHVAFEEDPLTILDAYEHLNELPPFSLNSDMEKVVPGTGMLPFQIQGFNYLKDPKLKGGLALWSTGTGKTALLTALIKWHEMRDEFDLCVIVVKSHNKKDMQRKIYKLGDIESIIIEGKIERRENIYEDLSLVVDEMKPVIITNYEKFREDEGYFKWLFEDRRVLIFWDEMPTRLRNRGTQIYDAVGRCLYKSWTRVMWHRKRPSWLRQYELTATPIENSPEDQLNCTRLIDPEIFPDVKSWERRFVLTYNFFSGDPELFRNLDEMGLMLEHMTHQVDRDDPDVSHMFPKVMHDSITIDWHEKDRAHYDKLQGIALALAEKAKDDPEVERLNPLALIGVLQMLCDAPSMVQESAENRKVYESLVDSLDDAGAYNDPTGSEAARILVDALRKPLTNDTHTKLDTLREILLEKHPDDKAMIFMTWGSYGFGPLEAKLEKWGVTYVSYKGTLKQKQVAKDQFRNDPSIRVYLSSDAGSDSTDLPEARVGVNYNLPWKPATKKQRQGRNDRVDAGHDVTYWYDLCMADSVEDRKREILETKTGYHDGVFGGEITDSSLSARMTNEDLMYILTGEHPNVD